MSSIYLRCVALVAAACWAELTAADDSPLAALDGTWKVVSVTENGEPVKDQGSMGATWTLGSHELLIEHSDSRVVPKGYRLKPEAESVPPAFQATSAKATKYPKSYVHLYEVKEDHLRFALFTRGAKRSMRPDSFEPTEGLTVIDVEKLPDPTAKT